MIFLAFVLGTSFGLLIGAAAGISIGKSSRNASRYEYRFESARTIDCEPTEFSHNWEAR